MINEEVERRVASYYMQNKMTEKQRIELEWTLLDAIWGSDEQISDDELVKIGVDLIIKYLDDDRSAK